jgi:hypothetical protein
MRTRSVLSFLLVSLAACGSSEETFVGELQANVVYGTDDRREVFAHPDAELQRIARESIVALIPSSRINREPTGDYSLFAFSLKDERGLCDDELFGNQPVAATCSGVLIADDLVLTAGHCISSQRACDAFRYVFNYHLDAPNQLAFIRDEDVYSCRSVALEEDAPSNGLTPDFAVIQLDRPVEGDHAPVAIRSAGSLPQGAPVSMIGFGSGLPAKIDDGASVAQARLEQEDFFVVNLDAFEGHSGSATFDSEARLAGILLGGRVPDYVVEAGESCARANVFEDSQAGEIVHNVAPIVAALCDEGLLEESCEEPDGCEVSCSGVISPGTGGGAGGTGGSPVAAPNESGCSAVAHARGRSAAWIVFLLLFACARLRRRAA